jgi:DNA-binding transcriptional ArsR family regulator
LYVMGKKELRNMTDAVPSRNSIAEVPEDGPVTMPLLPSKLALTTAQQVKAIADPLRARILGIIQHQPATAKQLADRLDVAPGSVGHHLQILESAGLAQVVARRLVHGIVAKYYTRTARIFTFEVPQEVLGESSLGLDWLAEAHSELAESLGTTGESAYLSGGFPHIRLTSERARVYRERLEALMNDLIEEPPEPAGQVYGLSIALFLAPPTLQAPGIAPRAMASPPPEEGSDQHAE